MSRPLGWCATLWVALRRTKKHFDAHRRILDVLIYSEGVLQTWKACTFYVDSLQTRRGSPQVAENWDGSGDKFRAQEAQINNTWATECLMHPSHAPDPRNPDYDFNGCDDLAPSGHKVNVCANHGTLLLECEPRSAKQMGTIGDTDWYGGWKVRQAASALTF